jgi:hypothetical protein
MQVVRLGQQRSCTFCRKPQSDGRVLIASPDKLSYICEECTLRPARLKNISQESRSKSDSAPSSMVGSFRLGRSQIALKCSLCRKATGLPGLYRSAVESGTYTYIADPRSQGTFFDINRLSPLE